MIAGIFILCVYNILIVGRLPRKLAERSQAQEDTRFERSASAPSNDIADDIDDAPIQIPKFNGGVPSVCHRSEYECKKKITCYNKKWQSIPSCKRASKRCSDMPVADQKQTPYCETCLDAGRDMSMCLLESAACAKIKENCFKVRQKQRSLVCESLKIQKWSVAYLKEISQSQQVSSDCATAIWAELNSFDEFQSASQLAWNKEERRAKAEADAKAKASRQAAVLAQTKARAVALLKEKAASSTGTPLSTKKLLNPKMLQKLTSALAAEVEPEVISYPSLEFGDIETEMGSSTEERVEDEER
ncbi:hypothetical protein CYMTET_49956 [Cymbomonas tetramitiformis]|uniref:Uncharacterized protein n=1 Tax=Cymbomonas tetramitiformis TaxID=36881 RepID=A0AAE0BQJ8_9CHLO|nr:hypothetical protein CYMTET_49956 [Cymbomonas tetramitiformis]